jgi:hypothetical protein
MKDHRRRRTGKPRVSPSVLDRINPNAAESIADPRSITSRCRLIEAHARSNSSGRSRAIWCASLTGWSPVA